MFSWEFCEIFKNIFLQSSSERLLLLLINWHPFEWISIVSFKFYRTREVIPSTEYSKLFESKKGVFVSMFIQ